MRIFKDNSEYQGTPEELDLFFKLSEPKADPWEEVAPLRDIVSESENLRMKLAKDPNYSPFGGVVPPRDADKDVSVKKTVTAEEDTGVQLI